MYCVLMIGWYDMVDMNDESIRRYVGQSTYHSVINPVR